MDNEKIAQIFKALGHPTRLNILQGLLRGHCNVSGISVQLGIPQPTISQHLALLRRVGIIEGKRDKSGTCYHITNKTVLKILSGL